VNAELYGHRPEKTIRIQGAAREGYLIAHIFRSYLPESCLMLGWSGVEAGLKLVRAQ
jgi:hypothetical protein